MKARKENLILALKEENKRIKKLNEEMQLTIKKMQRQESVNELQDSMEQMRQNHHTKEHDFERHLNEKQMENDYLMKENEFLKNEIRLINENKLDNEIMRTNRETQTNNNPYTQTERSAQRNRLIFTDCDTNERRDIND